MLDEISQEVHVITEVIPGPIHAVDFSMKVILVWLLILLEIKMYIWLQLRIQP